jgi:hypothetical protein
MPGRTGFFEDEMGGFQMDIHLFVVAWDDLKTEELMIKRARAVKVSNLDENFSNSVKT